MESMEPSGGESVIGLRVPRPARPAFLSWSEARWLELGVRASAIGCVLLVLTCCFGLFAVSKVAGTWRNAVEGERIAGSYGRANQPALIDNRGK